VSPHPPVLSQFKRPTPPTHPDSEHEPRIGYSLDKHQRRESSQALQPCRGRREHITSRAPHDPRVVPLRRGQVDADVGRPGERNGRAEEPPRLGSRRSTANSTEEKDNTQENGW
jgi:hypothetical protein